MKNSKGIWAMLKNYSESAILKRLEFVLNGKVETGSRLNCTADLVAWAYGGNIKFKECFHEFCEPYSTCYVWCPDCMRFSDAQKRYPALPSRAW
jgi:hypothetical protein